METNQIIFDGKPYIIRQTFYRTKGSRKQKLVTTKKDNTESRRTFYLVEYNKQLFWVKEYTKPTPYHDIGYEFSETKRLHSLTKIGVNEIRTVQMFCVENGRLLMEYCADYVKFHEASLTPQQKIVASQLIIRWLQEHPDIHNYDMCGNNILIKKDKTISIRLIDFEYSLKKNCQPWEDTCNAECWYKQAGTIVFFGGDYKYKKGKKDEV